MSKSSFLNDYDDKGCVFLLENLDSIRKKIFKSVTDSENNIKYDSEKKPGLSNLLTIYSSLKKCELKETVKYFQNFSYKMFKEEVATVVLEEIRIIQKNFYDLVKNIDLVKILKKSTQKVKNIAEKKLKEIKRKLGIDFN